MSDIDVLMVGADHRSTSLEVLEELHRRAAHGAVAEVLQAGAAGLVELTTCHRVELYLEGVAPARAADLYRRWLRLDAEAPDPPVVRIGADAAGHLLRVAAGLESAVLGEDQIIGQVRRAYRGACARRTPGPLLHRLFHAAFRAGKRARSETDLKRGGRSLAGCSVALLNRRFGGLKGCSALVIGAGEMAGIAARRLRRRGVRRLLVCNRTTERAQVLAEDVGGEVVPWSWRSRAVRSSDVVIVGTAATEPVVSAADLVRAAEGRSRPLVVVDLSVPRNLESPCGQVPFLEILDVGGLSEVLLGERERRESDVVQAGRIVDEELKTWIEWRTERVRRGVCRRSARGCATG